jgi:hypothetical protein
LARLLEATDRFGSRDAETGGDALGDCGSRVDDLVARKGFDKSVKNPGIMSAPEKSNPARPQSAMVPHILLQSERQDRMFAPVLLD